MEINNAYELSRNLDHIKSNGDYDVWQVIQKRDDKIKSFFWRLEPISRLPPHKFKGKVEKRLNWLDYPRDQFGYPIVSKKMLEVLTSVGQFKHQAIPLEIHDWKSDRKTDDFVFLHLLECIDVLDLEKTMFYEELEGMVSQAALKMPKDGYPPLFLVKDVLLTRFISKEAKEALEAADIKGVHFVPLIAS